MYPQAHTKTNCLCALLLWFATETNASIALGQESNLNALSKAAALLKESELPKLEGLKIKEVQRLPKIENTAWVNRDARNNKMWEHVIVFLPDGEYIQIFSDSDLDSYSEDYVHAWEIDDKGKWRTGQENGFVEIYGVQRWDGGPWGKNRVETLKGEQTWICTDKGIARAVLKDGKLVPWLEGQYKRLDDKLTLEAIKRAKVAKWAKWKS